MSLVFEDNSDRAALEVWTSTALTIATREDYVAAGERRVAIKAYLAKVHAYWDPTIQSAYTHYVDLRDQKRKPFLAPAEAEDEALQKAMTAWLQADDARQQALQDAAVADARRVAEEERLQAAVALEAAAPGDAHVQAAVDSLLDDPVDVAPVYLAPTVPVVTGLRGPTKRQVVTIVDPIATVLAVAAWVMLERLQKGPVSPQHRPVIHAFLSTFHPADATWAVKVDDVAVRRAAAQPRTAFKLAGVTVESKRTA